MVFCFTFDIEKGYLLLMKKIILILGIVIIALIVVVGVIGLFYIGPIVKAGIEQVGPKVTQVSIKVEAVDISLLSGSVAMKGLVVGNPHGYSTPQAISVGTMAVSLDPMSVTSNKIVVHSVHVLSPEITFEGGITSNNLTKILHNVTASSKNGSENPSKPAPKIEVDDFLITGAKVHVYLSNLVNKEIPLPDIHLTDLGKDSNGLTPAELTSAVLQAISSDTISAVASAVSRIDKDVKSLGQDTVKSVGASVSKITGSLGGLLGK